MASAGAQGAFDDNRERRLAWEQERGAACLAGTNAGV
jgi:hypothetical protein